MKELSPEVTAFLSHGKRTGMLGYLSSDGRPLVAPVWFIVDNGQLVFITGHDSAKGRYLARDARAVLCVDDPEAPSFVQVQGTAATSEEPEEVLDVAIRTSARYVGSERAEEFGRRNAQPGTLVVRVAPTKIVAAFDIAG